MIARCGWIVLAGCNSILGLGNIGERDANVRDARLFDAPTDASPQCPPLGTVPTFRPAVHSLPFANCQYYSISESAHLAMAYCYDQLGIPFVAEGELEGTLAQAATVDTASSYSPPRLGADGDVMARVAYHNTAYYSVELEHRDAPLTWSFAEALPYMPGTGVEETQPEITNLTAGPEPHIIWFELTTSGTDLREFAKRGGTWQQVDVYDYTTVAPFFENPVLTSDGLRMVFGGANGTFSYTDRPTIADRFRPAQTITNIPAILYAPVMTEDCGKLYFDALGTVLYLEQ